TRVTPNPAYLVDLGSRQCAASPEATLALPGALGATRPESRDGPLARPFPKISGIRGPPRRQKARTLGASSRPGVTLGTLDCDRAWRQPPRCPPNPIGPRVSGASSAPRPNDPSRAGRPTPDPGGR